MSRASEETSPDRDEGARGAQPEVARGDDRAAREVAGGDDGAGPAAAVPRPPWAARRREPRTPQRPPLSREAIVTAALAIVDAEGLDALSMRRVAQELGTGPASLYAHVSGKDELLELCIDRVASTLEVPDPDPEHWEEQVKDFVRALYHGLGAHRDLARASMARIPTGPGALAAIDRFLGILRAGGLPDQVAAYAVDLLPLYATASAYEQGLHAARGSPADVERYLQEVSDYFHALPADRFPNIAALADPLMSNPTPDARFEFGLDVLVRGLAAQAE